MSIQPLTSSDLTSLYSNSVGDGGLSIWSSIAKSLRSSVSLGTGLPRLTLLNPLAMADKMVSQYIVSNFYPLIFSHSVKYLLISHSLLESSFSWPLRSSLVSSLLGCFVAEKSFEIDVEADIQSNLG